MPEEVTKDERQCSHFLIDVSHAGTKYRRTAKNMWMYFINVGCSLG